MKMNVLAAVLASAGLATSAFGQNGTFVIEVRLVVDGDPNAPIGAGITSYAPGNGATRVGLSLQARVTQTASGTNVGSGNYGIVGILARSETSLARFAHNDSMFSGGDYLALRRGQTSSTLGADGLPQAGFFGADNNPHDLLGGTAGRDFRQLGLGNGPGPNPTRADVNSLAGNAPGATLPGQAASANGYFSDSASGISGLSSTINNLQAVDPIRYALGIASPWYNLYRVYFDPQPGTEHIGRFVTVAFTGRVRAGVRALDFAPTGTRLVFFGGPQGGQLDVTALSASFAVGAIPAPAAGVVLGLGGLMAARRRRVPRIV